MAKYSSAARDKSGAKSALRRLDVKPSKGRGQNFLQDLSVIEAIINFGRVSSKEKLLEIGPGLGALTERLFAISPALTVIEIQDELCEELKKKFPELNIINADVREIDLSKLGENLTIFGNLPYSFSTDIVFRLVDQASSIKRAILMLQREFCERMAAPPGGRDYGVLSISVQLACDVRLGPTVPGTSFYPAAKVESRVIELNFNKAQKFEIEDRTWFNKVVRASFSQRRRQLRNSLKGANLCPLDALDQSLQELGIAGTRRAETLSIQEFINLAERLGRAR